MPQIGAKSPSWEWCNSITRFDAAICQARRRTVPSPAGPPASRKSKKPAGAGPGDDDDQGLEALSHFDGTRSPTRTLVLRYVLVRYRLMMVTGSARLVIASGWQVVHNVLRSECPADLPAGCQALPRGRPLRRPLERFRHKGIEALTLPRRGDSYAPVQFRRQPHREIAGVRPLGFLPALAAPIDVIGDRLGERGPQFVERAALEGQHVTGIDDFAMEQPGVFVEFHRRQIAFMRHRRHGEIPASSKNRRTDLSAPLSVSFCGCGL